MSLSDGTTVFRVPNTLEPLMDAEFLCNPYLGLSEEPGGWAMAPEGPGLTPPSVSLNHMITHPCPPESPESTKRRDIASVTAHMSTLRPGSKSSSLRPNSSKQWGCRHQVGLAPGPPDPQEQECLLSSPSSGMPVVWIYTVLSCLLPHTQLDTCLRWWLA